MRTHDVNYARQKQKVLEHGRRSGPVVCEKGMGNAKTCPYCDQVSKLYRSDDSDDRDLAGRCRARSTFYMNIVNLSDLSSGVQVYGCGIENWRDLLDRLPDPDDVYDENVDYINPKSARTVFLKRTGSGLKTVYTISTGNKKLNVKKEWLKDMYSLHNILSLIEKDEVELWKPKVGKNKIYILPPWSKKAKGDFYFEVLYHWNVDSLVLDDPEDDSKEKEYGDDDWDDYEITADDDVPF